MLQELLIDPFADYGFMRRALVACLSLSLSATPLGMFLIVRRMTLMGDAMSHAILPGAALAYWMFGLSLLPMALGGLLAGFAVALLAGAASHFTQQQEDTSFTSLFTLSLALGVVIVSAQGSQADLLHMLFGNILGVDARALWLIVASASVSTFCLAACYRSFVAHAMDPVFLRMAGQPPLGLHLGFLALLVVNLVSAFHTLGTLLAVGMMILPCAAARFWARTLDAAIPLSVAFAVFSSYAGLLASYHGGLPTGPAIVLTAGILYAVSLCAGFYGSLLSRYLPRRHFAH